MTRKVSLLKNMANIREVLAANLKEYRRKRGVTQEQFAEKADVSSHYIAMIETCNTFPKPEMLERLAKAFNIESHELFSVEPAPDEAFEQMRRSIVSDIKQEITEMKRVVIQAIEKNRAASVKPKTRHSPPVT
jgi:transcriptional regulator with XRE-family HTH domain